MRILVIGASGQDGSMVAETYANSGHHVIGVTSKPVKSLHSQIEMLNIDFAKSEDARSLLQKFLPHRIYHLAAVHSSSTSSVQPNLHIRDSMYRCNVEITQNILEWQREEPSCKAVIALSSQMYSGHKGKQSINEESEFSPQNYYAQTKVQGFNLLREFRELYDTQTFGAILFNHTSSRSKGEFLFPQLVHQLKAVLKGESSKISLKNPDFKIDVCHASEVTHAMMQMIELKEASDFVIARGENESIRSFVSSALARLDLDGRCEIKKSDPEPTHNEGLVGNSSKAHRVFDWKASFSPEDILLEMLTSGQN